MSPLKWSYIHDSGVTVSFSSIFLQFVCFTHAFCVIQGNFEITVDDTLVFSKTKMGNRKTDTAGAVAAIQKKISK